MKIASAGLALVLAVPSPATAQTVARTFADLAAVLAPRDRVVVLDVTGRETTGPVESVAADSFTMAVTEKTPTGSRTLAERRTFREADVRSVRRLTETGAAGPVIYPVSWDRVHALPAGAMVRVSFTEGKTESYRFGAASARALTLTSASGQPLTISKASIARVVREGYRDSVSDGIALGALIGGGTMAVITAIAYANCDAGCEAPAPGPFFATSIAFGAGIGVAAGWVIDHFHKGSDVVFPVAAIITPGVKALYIARRF